MTPLTAEQIVQIHDAITEASKDSEYVDNWRWARVGNPEEEAVYEKLLRRGCCGSHDETIEIPGIGQVMIGFNYGH